MSNLNFPKLDEHYDSINLCNQLAKNNNLILIYVKNRFDDYSKHGTDNVIFHKCENTEKFLLFLSNLVRKYFCGKENCYHDLEMNTDNSINMFCDEEWVALNIFNLPNDLAEYISENVTKLP